MNGCSLYLFIRVLYLVRCTFLILQKRVSATQPALKHGKTRRHDITNTGKVAIITGAASGIGLESCVLFAKEGCKVVCCDINEAAGLKTLDLIHKFIPASSKPAVFVKVDVSKESDLKHAVEIAEQEFGKLDIIFNNAGIMHPNDDDAVSTEEAVWDLTMNINVKGVWWGCRHAIPAMKRAGGGTCI
jgi:NAD(P)-dependent dehydrogenase (short-subunit alcohol dehydrogenase family)